MREREREVIGRETETCRGGGLVVSVLAFDSDDPRSFPGKAYSFFCKILYVKNENKPKRGRGWPIFSNDCY